jgi:hypothetical protein
MTISSNDDVLRRTAEAFAQLRIPRFWDFDPDTVQTAFSSVVDPFTGDAAWVSRLGEDVRAISHGRVQVRRATDAELTDFAPLIKGPAEYLIVGDATRTLRVIVVPTAQPMLLRADR